MSSSYRVLSHYMARQLTKMPCPQRVQNKFHPYKGRSSDSSKINLATCNWPKVINIKLQEDSVCVCVCVWQSKFFQGKSNSIERVEVWFRWVRFAGNYLNRNENGFANAIPVGLGVTKCCCCCCCCCGHNWTMRMQVTLIFSFVYTMKCAIWAFSECENETWLVYLEENWRIKTFR